MSFGRLGSQRISTELNGVAAHAPGAGPHFSPEMLASVGLTEEAAKKEGKDVKIISLQTFRHLTDEAADESLLFTPHSDLLLANAIAHAIVRDGKAVRGRRHERDRR